MRGDYRRFVVCVLMIFAAMPCRSYAQDHEPDTGQAPVVLSNTPQGLISARSNDVRWRRSLLGLAGSGLALGALAAVTGGLSLRADADFARRCPPDACDETQRRELQDLVDRTERYGRATDALLVAGGVMLVVSLTFYLVRRRPPGSRSSAAVGLGAPQDAPWSAVLRW